MSSCSPSACAPDASCYNSGRWKRPHRRLTDTFTVLLALCLLATGTAAARIWTDDLNRTWQGDFLRVDGPAAVFLVDRKEFSFPLARLSAADKLLIFKLRQTAAAAPVPVPAPGGSPAVALSAAPASGGPAMPASFGSARIEPGKTVESDLPLAGAASALVTRCYTAKSPVTRIRASLAVPAGFDADRPQKVLIASVSATGDTPSIADAEHLYAPDALAHGWLVLAADGPDGKPKNHGDSTEYRLELLKTTLAELTRCFPKAKTDWTFATAGFSGGCGYAGHQALWLSAQGYRVTGIMMLNCNYPPTMWEHAPEMRGNTGRWHQIPAFFSYGEKDDVAKPAMIKEAIETTKRGGYQRVRVEAHPGGHQPWDAHINLALEWFDSLAQGGAH